MEAKGEKIRRSQQAFPVPAENVKSPSSAHRRPHNETLTKARI